MRNLKGDHGWQRDPRGHVKVSYKEVLGYIDQEGEGKEQDPTTPPLLFVLLLSSVLWLPRLFRCWCSCS